jgi:hypothetical protein
LRDAIYALKRGLKRAQQELKVGVAARQKEWDKFLKDEGSIVRLDGELLSLDGGEADLCAVCGKFFKLDGDGWDDLDPGCADKVSEHMDDRGMDRDQAIEAFKREKRLAR